MILLNDSMNLVGFVLIVAFLFFSSMFAKMYFHFNHIKETAGKKYDNMRFESLLVSPVKALMNLDLVFQLIYVPLFKYDSSSKNKKWGVWFTYCSLLFLSVLLFVMGASEELLMKLL